MKIWIISVLLFFLYDEVYTSCSYYYSYYTSKLRVSFYYAYSYYYYYIYKDKSSEDDFPIGLVIGGTLGGIVGFLICSGLCIIICKTVCKKSQRVNTAPIQSGNVSATATANQNPTTYTQLNTPMYYPPPAYLGPPYHGQPLPTQQASTTATVGTYTPTPPVPHQSTSWVEDKNRSSAMYNTAQ